MTSMVSRSHASAFSTVINIRKKIKCWNRLHHIGQRPVIYPERVAPETRPFYRPCCPMYTTISHPIQLQDSYPFGFGRLKL